MSRCFSAAVLWLAWWSSHATKTH